MSKEKTVRLLLGNSEERLNNILEKLARDVFAGEAMLQATRIAKVADFTRQACAEHFDLVILLTDGLTPGYRPQGSPGPVAEAVGAISAIKQARHVPILAFSPRTQDEPALLEAGAEHVLGIPFKCDEVKTIVRRMVTLEAPGEGSPAIRWSLGEMLRGWRRLAQN
jgi:hypothetical protein